MILRRRQRNTTNKTNSIKPACDPAIYQILRFWAIQLDLNSSDFSDSSYQGFILSSKLSHSFDTSEPYYFTITTPNHFDTSALASYNIKLSPSHNE